MVEEESSGSSDESSDDERKNLSFDERMKRITQLGKEGKIEELIKEAQMEDCNAAMIEHAAKKSKDLGNEAFAKKEYEQALEHYAGALVGDCPEKFKIYSNRSACLFQLGKYTEALLEAVKSIKDNRSWSKGYFRAGRAALEMEYYDEAYDMFQKGLEKDPANKDLIEWTEKAKTVRNQHQQSKLMKKHTTDYSKFDELSKQQQDEEDEEAMENDPNAVVFGDRYYSSSKMEQRQLKAMLGYKEAPPPPFEPTFDTELIYRHDNRGAKTSNPIWDPSRREWRIDAKPAPSRID
jgi:tetratricopeptide (TPR) repeat protein